MNTVTEIIESGAGSVGLMELPHQVLKADNKSIVELPHQPRHSLGPPATSRQALKVTYVRSLAELESIDQSRSMLYHAQQTFNPLTLLCDFYNDISVEGLRAQGYQIKISHQRYSEAAVAMMRAEGITHDESRLKPGYEFRRSFEMNREQGYAPITTIAANGGKTIVSIIEPNGTGEKIDGVALCSLMDSYNKRKGVLICLGRIFHQLCTLHGYPKTTVTKYAKAKQAVLAPTFRSLVDEFDFHFTD